jgi:hypothetical protein
VIKLIALGFSVFVGAPCPMQSFSCDAYQSTIRESSLKQTKEHVVKMTRKTTQFFPLLMRTYQKMEKVIRHKAE